MYFYICSLKCANLSFCRSLVLVVPQHKHHKSYVE